MSHQNLVHFTSWRVPLVGQELPTLPENMSLLPVFSGVRVSRSLVLYVCFVERSLSLWSLCCLSFDLRILITSFMSSSSFCTAFFRKSPWYVFQYSVCYLYLFHLHFPLPKMAALDQEHYLLLLYLLYIVLFLLAIVFSALLRYTDYDYLFGIFKLFLSLKCELFSL
jgi:hypothetical protein